MMQLLTNAALCRWYQPSLAIRLQILSPLDARGVLSSTVGCDPITRTVWVEQSIDESCRPDHGPCELAIPWTRCTLQGCRTFKI